MQQGVILFSIDYKNNPPKLKKTILNIIKFLLFVGVGATILYFVYQKQNANYIADCALKGIPDSECSLMTKVINDFKNANYWWVLSVLAAFTISNVSRALRWQMLVKPLNYRPKFSNAYHTVMIGYFANLGFPRIGEVIRAGMFARYEKIPVEKVMGTIVSDRLLDVICILIATGLAVFLEYDTIIDYFRANADLDSKLEGLMNSGILLYLFLGGLVLLAIPFIFRKQLMQSRLFFKIKDVVFGFWQGIQTVWKVRPLGWFLFHTFNIWFMYFLMIYLCFFAFEPTAHLPAVAALMVFVFGAWGIVIPSPGGMGSYHFLAMAALALYGINGNDAFSFSNISFFSIQIGCNILFGLIALVALPIINKNYTPKPVESDE